MRLGKSTTLFPNSACAGLRPSSPALHLLRRTLFRGSLHPLLRHNSRYLMLASPLYASPAPFTPESTKYTKDIDSFNKLLPPPIEFIEGSSSGALAVPEGKYEPINATPKAGKPEVRPYRSFRLVQLKKCLNSSGRVIPHLRLQQQKDPLRLLPPGRAQRLPLFILVLSKQPGPRIATPLRVYTTVAIRVF